MSVVKMLIVMKPDTFCKEQSNEEREGWGIKQRDEGGDR
jgi:hypothetical protein